MKARKPASPALLALTASALSLPGMARPPADEVRVDYRYSTYREDALSASKTGGADGRRYEIDTQQFRLTAPAGENLELALDFTYESMTGASPWFITPDTNNKPVQVMSGASIEEKRTDVLLGVTSGSAATNVTVSAGYTNEGDYRAVNAGLRGEHELADTITTLSGGVGYSDDDVEPTEGASTNFPKRIARAQRDALTGFAGAARVLSADTVVQTSVSFTEQGGFLSDPYKEAWIVSISDTVPDSRPNGRRQFAWLTRLRSFFPSVKAALHLDYRLYDDDWDITAHTVDLAWHQNYPYGIRITPAVRMYSQSQAYFYQPFYNQPRNDNFYSSDYRLSPYGALGLSITANVDIQSWGLNLRYENYDSGANYALGNVQTENPGLVDFGVLSAGVKKVF